jgi:hypothetical protein
VFQTEGISVQSSRLYKYFFLAILAATTVSCSNETKKKPVKNGVDAEILNLQDSTVRLYSVLSPLDQIKGIESSFHLDIEVDSNGIFVRPLDLEEGYYILEHDHVRSLYFIQSGKRLSLDFDATKPSVQPNFSGQLKYESRYLYDRYLAHAQFSAKQSTYYSYSELDFVTELTQVRGHLDTALVMYIVNHPTGSTYFMEQESLTNLYFMAAYLEAYASKRIATEGNTTELSISYFDVLNTLNVNDTKAVNNPEFYTFIQNHVWARSGAPVNTANVLHQITFVDSAFTVAYYQDYLRFQAAKEVTTWTGSEERTAMLDTLSGLIQDADIQSFLIQNIQNDTASLPIESQTILEDQ